MTEPVEHVLPTAAGGQPPAAQAVGEVVRVLSRRWRGPPRRQTPESWEP